MTCPPPSPREPSTKNPFALAAACTAAAAAVGTTTAAAGTTTAAAAAAAAAAADAADAAVDDGDPSGLSSVAAVELVPLPRRSLLRFFVLCGLGRMNRSNRSAISSLLALVDTGIY